MGYSSFLPNTQYCSGRILGKTTSLEAGRTVYAQVPCALPLIDCGERRVFSALYPIMLTEELSVNTYFNYKFHLKSCKKELGNWQNSVWIHITSPWIVTHQSSQFQGIKPRRTTGFEPVISITSSVIVHKHSSIRDKLSVEIRYICSFFEDLKINILHYPSIAVQGFEMNVSHQSLTPSHSTLNLFLP